MNIIDRVNIRKGQKQPTIHSCTELNKTQFFPVSIVKVKLKKNVQGKQNLQTDQMEDHVVFSCELNYTTTR